MCFLMRFGAACGVVLAASIGVPGLIEAFTGETTATSFVLGLGAAAGPPAVTALFLYAGWSGARQGAFDRLAYAICAIGLGLFGGVAFALNLVLFFLDEQVVDDLLAGPTGTAVTVSALTFVLGTLLFGISMARSGVLARTPAIGFAVTLPLLALLAPLKDSPISSALHVLAGVTIIWLSTQVWRGTGRVATDEIPELVES